MILALCVTTCTILVTIILLKTSVKKIGHPHTLVHEIVITEQFSLQLYKILTLILNYIKLYLI